MKPIILDNILPQVFQDKLLKTFTHPDFDWHYNSGISLPDSQKEELNSYMSNDNNIAESDAFVHRLLINHDEYDYYKSNYYEVVHPIFYFIQEKINLKIKNVLRARAVFYYKQPELKGKYNAPHVDQFTKHLSTIVFLSDSDGSTILFEDKYERGVSNTSKKNIEYAIEAKKGRILIFDGLQFHTGLIPTKSNKIILNINIDGEIL